MDDVIGILRPPGNLTLLGNDATGRHVNVAVTKGKGWVDQPKIHSHQAGIRGIESGHVELRVRSYVRAGGDS
jgi:hypothetical protein